MEEIVSEYTFYRQLEGHDNTITALSFHPIQTDRLVSSSLDQTLGLWTKDQSKGKKFRAHLADILDVCYSSDGELIASASKDKSIRIWLPDDEIYCSEFKAHHSAVRSIQFSPNGDNFVSASNDKSVMLWIPSQGKYFKTFIGHTNKVRCAKFSPDGKLLASCSDDKTIKIWDITCGQYIKTFYDKKAARYVDFHPTGTIIGSANVDGCVKLYDLRMDSLHQYYPVHTARVNMIKFHPSGNFILTASDDSTMKISDFLGRPVYTLRKHCDKVTCIAFSNDGKLFASGSKDQQILIWKCNNLCVDGQSRESPTQLMSSTTNKNLMTLISSKQEFDDGDEKSNRNEHEENVHEKQIQENYLSNKLKRHQESGNNAELSTEIVKSEISNMNMKPSQVDCVENVLTFSQQSHSSKQTQTDPEDQISLNTFSSIKIKIDQVLSQIQLLRCNYDVLEQRLTILEESFKKLDH